MKCHCYVTRGEHTIIVHPPRVRPWGASLKKLSHEVSIDQTQALILGPDVAHERICVEESQRSQEYRSGRAWESRHETKRRTQRTMRMIARSSVNYRKIKHYVVNWHNQIASWGSKQPFREFQFHPKHISILSAARGKRAALFNPSTTPLLKRPVYLGWLQAFE